MWIISNESAFTELPVSQKRYKHQTQNKNTIALFQELKFGLFNFFKQLKLVFANYNCKYINFWMWLVQIYQTLFIQFLEQYINKVWLKVCKFRFDKGYPKSSQVLVPKPKSSHEHFFYRIKTFYNKNGYRRHLQKCYMHYHIISNNILSRSFKYTCLFFLSFRNKFISFDN